MSLVPHFKFGINGVQQRRCHDLCGRCDGYCEQVRDTPFEPPRPPSWHSTISRARARELPGHSLFIVTKRLIKKSTEKWEAPSYELLQSVYRVLTKETNRMIDEHFHRFRCGRLHQDVKWVHFFRLSLKLLADRPHVRRRSIVNQVLETCQASALRMIKQLLTMEGKAPFTLHEPNLVTSREQLLKGYREQRWNLLHNGINRLKPEELIARDEYDQALMYMANARAYFLSSPLHRSQLPAERLPYLQLHSNVSRIWFQ